MCVVGLNKRRDAAPVEDEHVAFAPNQLRDLFRAVRTEPVEENDDGLGGVSSAGQNPFECLDHVPRTIGSVFLHLEQQPLWDVVRIGKIG